MPQERTQLGDGNGHFRTTRWSLISEIRDPNSRHSREIRNALFKDYWKPVYFYIRNKGVSSEKAKDLTQDFFCNILCEKNLFEKAQKNKGTLRSLLLTSLKNFLISTNRYEAAQKRDSNREIFNIDLLENVSMPESCQTCQEEESFNYAWITSLLDNVSEQVREQYCSKGKEIYWTAFDKRFRTPTLQNTPAPSLSQICKELGLEDEVKASNMITSVKRSFQKTLRSHIREYVYTDHDVDEELSELLTFLRKNMQDTK